MPSETETLALYLVRALYNATDGRPLHWRMSAEIDGATTDAIAFAVARGWVIVEASHSICLTDAGRRLVGFPYPPVNADGAAMAVETARNICLYQYMIVAGAIFVGLVGWLLPHRWFRWSVGVSAILIFFIWFQVQLDVMINNWFGTFYNMIQQALGKPGAVTQEQDNDWFIAHRKGANQARFQLIRVRQSQLCGALLSWDAADPQSLESKGLSGKSPNSGRPSQKTTPGTWPFPARSG